MKTFLVILAIAALVVLNDARPSRRGGPRGTRGGPGGPGRGGPRGPKGPGGLLRKVCEVRFADGTTRSKDCFKANGLFDCQPIDLAEFTRIPRPLENATEISLCLPVQCTANSDCSSIDARSVCVDGLPKPDEAAREEIKALRESCMPKPQRPEADEDDEDDGEDQSSRGRRGRGPRRGPRRDDNDQDGNDEDELFLASRKMCSVPPSYFVASRACRVVDTDGSDIRTKECKSRRNETVTFPCNATSACEVSYQGRNVKLHFCEKPERPERPQNPQGGDNGSAQNQGRLSSDNGNGQARNGRFGNGRFGNGRFGNGRLSGDNQNAELDNVEDSQTEGNGRRGGNRGSGRGRNGGRRGPGNRRGRGDEQDPEQNNDTDQP